MWFVGIYWKYKAYKLIKLISFSPTRVLSHRMDCVRGENGENELKGHCILLLKDVDDRKERRSAVRQPRESRESDERV